MTNYATWITSLFDRPETLGDWRWNIDGEPADLSDVDSVEFFIRLTNDLPLLVEQHSPWQISLGLDYLFNGSTSNFIFPMRDGAAPIERRVEAIRAIRKIYQHVFEPLCEPKLGSLSEGESKVNEFCYMLWDTTPLISCKGSPDEQVLHAALAESMEFAIQSDNIACIESGLHGLGHMTFDYPPCSVQR